MEIAEIVSRADGSAGWCLMVEGVMGASAGAFLPDAGARTVYPNGADVTMAGQGVPRGYATPVDGGYRIRGHWGYGSSIWHAEWVHSGCFVMDGDKMKMGADGHPVIVLCHHPKDTIELKGNWDTHGLRGTGSFDYTIKGGGELFVPASQCYPFDNPPQMRGGPQYASGLVGSTSWGHTSWALGVGRRALDELAKLARERTDVFGRMCDGASFKMSFADAEAKYRAARAFVYASWESLSESFAKGETGSVEQLALIRLAMRHLHNVISEISTFAHRASRGVSLRPGVLQRCYRDIHSGTQHILLADEITQECGRVLLGVTGKDAKWTVFGVQG
jgi:alkylation response protein AidB-like acyl-CoA dehydrogenase